MLLRQKQIFKLKHNSKLLINIYMDHILIHIGHEQ